LTVLKKRSILKISKIIERMTAAGESIDEATEGASFKKTLEANLSGRQNRSGTHLWRARMSNATPKGLNSQVKGQRRGRKMLPLSVLFIWLAACFQKCGWRNSI
jgi:hypothetical protein